MYISSCLVALKRLKQNPSKAKENLITRVIENIKINV